MIIEFCYKHPEALQNREKLGVKSLNTNRLKQRCYSNLTYNLVDQ